MQVAIDIRKNARANAAEYFEKAKKNRKKIEQAEFAIKEAEKKLRETEQREIEKEKTEETARKKEWYEKFRWFISSENFLVIGGRDATQNEIIIKKHAEQNDVVFHTDMAGSPFVVVKGGASAGEATLKEAAQFTATYSKAWKAGLAAADVYWIKPEQVSKEAPAGEYLVKGAFMIYGQKNHFRSMPLETAIGWDGTKIIYGPGPAVSAKTKNFVLVRPGYTDQLKLANKVKSALAKNDEKVKKLNPDEIQSALPAGKGDIKK